MISKETKISIFITLIGTAIGNIILPLNPFEQYIPNVVWRVVLTIIIGAIIFSIMIFLCFPIWNAKKSLLFAEYNLWHEGKMRGLWKGDGLIEQIEACSKRASSIKIKVTRGKDLLEKGNKYGFRKIFEELDDDVGKNQEVSVQVLLIVPCFREEHVKERYKYHNEVKEITVPDFLKTWVTVQGLRPEEGITNRLSPDRREPAEWLGRG